MMATDSGLGSLRSEVINEMDDSKKLVIAIDIGTYASGFAYQYRDVYKASPLQIMGKKDWHTGGPTSYKTPTCLLLDENTKLLEFGYEAGIKYSMYNTTDITSKPNGWENYYYFSNYKMEIYAKNRLTDDTPIEAAGGKNLPAIIVFARTIKFFKDVLNRHFVSNGTIRVKKGSNAIPQLESLDGIEVTWVITVPAIWDEQAKQLMQRAAIEAGIKNENLVIALEPECAAIYCSHLSRSQLQIYEEEGSIKHVVHPGAVIMVVDIGGGTVDISVIEINDDSTMKQVHKSRGGAYGGVRINEKILEALRDMTGQEVMSEFSSKHCIEEYDLRLEIEISKRKVNSPGKETPDTFIIRMPRELERIWRSKCQEFKEVLSKNDVKYEGGKLMFKSDKIREYFQDTIDEILAHLKEILDSSSGVKPGAMIVVGGFAESKYVIDSLREKLEDKMIPVIRPDNAEMSVLNGAVLFGQNDEIIQSRKAPHSYGIAMTMEFNDNLHSEEEKYEECDGTKMANNVFRKHITIDDDVELGKWVTSKEYYITSEDNPTSRVYVFISDKIKPIHTTEAGSKCIGHFDIDFPDGEEENTDKKSNKKEVKVEFNFGGTLLRVRAVSTCCGQAHTRMLQIKYNEMFKE